MKVLFTFGGMPHYLSAMLDKLQNQGVEVIVVTPEKGKDRKSTRLNSSHT